MKFCENDHQQMLERLAKFGGQMTSEENCTKITKLQIGQTVHLHFE